MANTRRTTEIAARWRSVARLGKETRVSVHGKGHVRRQAPSSCEVTQLDRLPVTPTPARPHSARCPANGHFQELHLVRTLLRLATSVLFTLVSGPVLSAQTFTDLVKVGQTVHSLS